jgi:antitoxin component of MazEF toxin-antitoxin module
MSKKNDDTVSKSVRLPLELVEYVELQEGKTFSAKLISLLEDIHSGDARRRKTLTEYDRQIEERSQKLTEISHNMYNAMLVTQKLEQFYRSISSIVDNEEPNRR